MKTLNFAKAKIGDLVVAHVEADRFPGYIVAKIPAIKRKGWGLSHGPLIVVCHRSNADDPEADWGTYGIREHIGGSCYRSDYELWSPDHLYAARIIGKNRAGGEIFAERIRNL